VLFYERIIAKISELGNTFTREKDVFLFRCCECDDAHTVTAKNGFLINTKPCFLRRAFNFKVC